MKYLIGTCLQRLQSLLTTSKAKQIRKILKERTSLGLTKQLLSGAKKIEVESGGKTHRFEVIGR